MRKLKILIVDDIFINRYLVMEIVRKLGHEYVLAENGKEAVELIEANDFDLVFMDIEMPVMNGLETTRYIREKMKFPKNLIPVVAITAHNPNFFFEDFTDTGFNNLLAKPFSMKKINSVIEELVKG